MQKQSFLSLERSDGFSLVLLAAATAAAWVGLGRSGDMMDLLPFLGTWSLMMAAMMLPSIAPPRTSRSWQSLGACGGLSHGVGHVRRPSVGCHEVVVAPGTVDRAGRCRTL
jgi:hypothetical protein